MTVTDAPDTTSPRPARPERLHDLDALRGVAMLLGIVLHASLAYFPAGWAVQDSQIGERTWIDEVEFAIHGFRMPLFFLLSGFFTTMLWRRRGLVALARQRTTRIVIPLLIGVFTIVPLMDAVVERALENGDPVQGSIAAVIEGDADRLAGLIDEGLDVTGTDERGGTLLHAAAFMGHLDVVDLLLDAGADPDARAFEPTDPDGQSPLDLAAIRGNEALADRLVAAGAPDPRPAGTSWQELGWWALLADEGGASAKSEQGGWDESLHHLWFLWYLTLLVVGFLIVATVLDALPLPAGADRVAGWIMWFLIPLTAWVHWQMADAEGLLFGPATSVEWAPSWPIVRYYAVFFAFGALAYGRTGRDGRLVVRSVARRWPLTLAAAFVMFFVALDYLEGEQPEYQVATALQAVFTWLAIFGLMGLFHHFLATERRGMRYLSDSAYWLYVAHLPLVIFLQDEIRAWELAVEVKFIALTVVATVLLLVSYQLVVRYTPIGWLLNGRRTPTRMNLPWAQVPARDTDPATVPTGS